jgi:hypothetical protein
MGLLKTKYGVHRRDAEDAEKKRPPQMKRMNTDKGKPKDRSNHGLRG